MDFNDLDLKDVEKDWVYTCIVNVSNTLTPRIITWSTTSFSAIGKAFFLEKLSLAVWDNKLLIKQITIHTKMPVCKLSFHAE